MTTHRFATSPLLFALLGGATLVGCADDTSAADTGDSSTGSTNPTTSTATSAETSSSSPTTTADTSSTSAPTTADSSSSAGESSTTGSPLEPLECDVAIIGGGVGGLHTAFRLAPELGDTVCLFERETELGGRIHDVPLDENDPDSPRFGTGARRVMEGQTVLFDLATELGLELDTPETTADLVNARGLFGVSKEALLPAYPALVPDVSGDTETAYYEAILYGPARAEAPNYADFRTYITAIFGSEGLAFLHDASRFRADFEYPLDAEGYMSYLDEEWNVCCTPSYPVGGMSTFIRGMEDGATKGGVRVFTGEPANVIQRSGKGYEVLTDLHAVSANRIVIAIPPVALATMTGDVVEEIIAEPEFQEIIGVKVVTVTQWWPNNWWSQIVDPADDTPVWRAWTTEHCVNFIEIPLDQYGVDQLATRSVYDDDANCVAFWEALYEQGGEAAVEEEVRRGLEHLFNDNGVTMPDTVTIPKPIKTHVQIWPAAWHWLVAGASFTNAEVFDWAIEPLPGEEVALVGEAYNLNRSGWSDAAFKSSINLLNAKYGFDLFVPEPGLASAREGSRARGVSQR